MKINAPMRAEREPHKNDRSAYAFNTFALKAAADWPNIDVDQTAFCAHLAKRFSDAEQSHMLSSLHWSDLYLAFACLQRHREAWNALEQKISDDVAPTLRRLYSDLADDVLAMLRQSLVGSNGQPCRLESYRGLGSLNGWLTTVSINLAVCEVRKHGREIPTDEFAMLEGATQSPELERLKEVDRGEFRKAIVEAFAQLSARDRNVLRLNFEKGLNVDKIGHIYGVHRATVARWIAQARQHVFETTHRWLQRAHGYSPEEVQSLVRGLDGNPGVSLHSLFYTLQSA